MFDTRAPKKLITVQEWFLRQITQKLQDDTSIAPFAPNGTPFAQEAKKYIVETKTLSAKKRIELYAQSYWLRLLEVLHQDFPILLRLFGEHDFHQVLAVPYLEHFRPNHWALSHLGNRFAEWVQSFYTQKDFELVHTCATIDWACQTLFYAKAEPKISLTQDQEKVATEKLSLQPTVQLFRFKAHFLHFRQALLAHDAEYWQTHDFPPLEKDKTFYFILYRNPSYTIDWQEVSKEEYVLLEAIGKNMTIEDAYESVSENDSNSLQTIDENIASWMQKWLIHDWICFS